MKHQRAALAKQSADLMVSSTRRSMRLGLRWLLDSASEDIIAIKYAVMICLFFGSFNPIHWGHIALGRYAYERIGCREVWFALSPLNPQKEASAQWPYHERKRLALEALEPYPYMRLCEIERDLPRPLYTWRSIQGLRLLYPKQKFILLVGSDNLLKLRSWMRWQYLLSLIDLYVYPRPGYPIETEDLADIPYTLCEDAQEHDISSTQIRQQIPSPARQA